jgi:uncharacterized protein YbjT (DUF2867 family)
VQTLGVHGPEDLTFAQVATVLTDVLGRPITAQQVSEPEQGQALAGFGMTPAQVEAILGMARGFDGDFEPQDPRSVATTTPTTLGAWAYQHLRPVLTS